MPGAAPDAFDQLGLQCGQEGPQFPCRRGTDALLPASGGLRMPKPEGQAAYPGRHPATAREQHRAHRIGRHTLMHALSNPGSQQQRARSQHRARCRSAIQRDPVARPEDEIALLRLHADLAAQDQPEHRRVSRGIQHGRTRPHAELDAIVRARQASCGLPARHRGDGGD